MASRWLVTGAGGMVGRDVVSQLTALEERVTAAGHADLDIGMQRDVDRVVDEVKPSIILNCAAFTRVDDAEVQEQEATRVNGEGVRYLAEGANRHGSLLVHISTDFVFNGEKSVPYEPDDATAPLSAYGRSKLAGEVAAQTADRYAIVRTAWLFGLHGWNFVEAIRKQLDAGRKVLRVVDDQRGRPTYTPHLAQALIQIAEAALNDDRHRGIFHYADEPECTWFDLASSILGGLHLQGALSEGVRVEPVSSAEFPRPAARPAYSVLSTRRYEEVTGRVPASWEMGLQEYLSNR